MRSVLPVAADLEPVRSVSLHKYDGLRSERKYCILPFINTAIRQVCGWGLRGEVAKRGRVDAPRSGLRRAPNKSYRIDESEYLTCFFGLFFQFDTPLSKALDFL